MADLYGNTTDLETIVELIKNLPPVSAFQASYNGSRICVINNTKN